MTERENLLKAMRRDHPDHVPFCFDLCDSLRATFRAKYGHDDYMKEFGMPFRYAGPRASRYPADFSPYYAGTTLPEGTTIDEWGVAYVPGGYMHFTRMLHPMADFTSAEQVRAFPLPDLLAPYRWEGVADRVAKIRADGFAAVYSAIQIFEPAWYLRGMDNFLTDMVLEPEIAHACLDRITEILTVVSARVAAAGVDMIVFGDDVGTQHGLMMSPALWREWLKPTMRTVIAAAKEANPDVLAYYHSDGVIDDIIEDLIEIGVDILNPVQPECVDPARLKRAYGDRLSFWGAIGTQTTMPFGTPADVEAAVRDLIDIVGKGGGLMIAPTHLLEPEVPWENVEALAAAVRKYGKY